MAFRGRMGNILLKVQYQFESIFGRLGLSSRIRMEAPTSTFLNQGFRQVQVLETMLMERCSNSRWTEQVAPFSTFQVKLDNYKSFPNEFPSSSGAVKSYPLQISQKYRILSSSPVRVHRLSNFDLGH